METLLKLIRKQYPLPEEEASLISSFFVARTFKRKDVLLRQGETAHHLYFVTRGILHMYYADEYGQTHSCNFFMPEEMATDLESFSKQAPAANYIEALTPTECLSISCRDTVSLMKQSSAFNQYALNLIEVIAMENINRTKDLLVLGPEARYNKLLDTRPDIVQAVPLKYIARFLGISPESLSRIRKRIVA